MNVLVLAEQLARPATGIGRYTAALVSAVVADAAFDLSVACTPGGAELAESLGVRADRVVRLPEPLLVRSVACLAGTGLRSAHRPDVVHGTKHFVPLHGAPAVLTVHDLYALEASGPSDRLRRWGYQRSLARAAVLAPTNDQVAAELGDRVGTAADRTVVYRPPFTASHREAVPVAAAPADFALHVSDLDPRKNAALLLDIWPEVHRATGVPLLLVGARHATSADLNRVGLLAGEGVVVDLGPVAEPELTWLYQQARVLLFPSWSEGWGYPVEEALAVGCPVVSSPVPAVAGLEATPDSLVVVAPADRAGWLDASVKACDRPVPAGDRARAAHAPPAAGQAGGQGTLATLYERALGAAA